MQLGFGKANYKNHIHKQTLSWRRARGTRPQYGAATAINFKIDMPLHFGKAHHKISPKDKSGCGHGLEELPKIREFLFNVSAMAEASGFKYSRSLVLVRPIIKSHRQIIVSVVMG